MDVYKIGFLRHPSDHVHQQPAGAHLGFKELPVWPSHHNAVVSAGSGRDMCQRRGWDFCSVWLSFLHAETSH